MTTKRRDRRIIKHLPGRGQTLCGKRPSPAGITYVVSMADFASDDDAKTTRRCARCEVAS